MNIGSLWSRNSFGKVIGVGDAILVKNEAGLQWSVGREIFDKEFTIADAYKTEGQDNRTNILKKIMEYPRTAMTIAFRKKVEPKTVIDAALDVLSSWEPVKDCKLAPEKELKKAIRTAMKGELRVMKGRHYGQMDPHGRLRVVDMEDPELTLKSVDPRTIEWAIVNGVKYEVKK